MLVLLVLSPFIPLFALMVHEGAHALMARCRRVHYVWFWDGRHIGLDLDEHAPRTALRSIAAAGPIAELVALLCWLVVLVVQEVIIWPMFIPQIAYAIWYGNEEIRRVEAEVEE